MTKLLESALWYLEKWRVNPVFCNIYKKPLHSWGELYGAKLTRADVERIYASAERPSGVAVLPSAESRIVVVDLDLYRAGAQFNTAEIAKTLASSDFVVALTPRGGLRVVFSAPDRASLPSRLAVYWHDSRIGEGAGVHKHLWHMPPSVACADDQCTKKAQYVFTLPDGATCKYPWELPWEAPPVHEVSVAFSVIESVVGVRIEAEASTSEKASGELKLTTAQVAPKPTIPCWLNLRDFEEWLAGMRPPGIALPACVARALGYYTTSDGRNIPGAGKVPRGLRFTLGALAVMFLVATIADAKPEEIVDFVGRNLEDYPLDEGEPLNTRFSRLIVVHNGHAYPKYSGLGAIGTSIPPELCRSCNYAMRCRVSTKRTNRFIVWQAFSEAFWRSLPNWYFKVER